MKKKPDKLIFFKPMFSKVNMSSTHHQLSSPPEQKTDEWFWKKKKADELKKYRLKKEKPDEFLIFF